MSVKFCYIDFEYIPKGQDYDLVCCCLQLNNADNPEHYWLYQDVFRQQVLHDRLHDLINENYIFVAFYVDAEARCCLELLLDPLQMHWLDAHIIGLPFYHSSLLYADFSVTNYPTEEKFYLDEESDEDEDYQKEEAQTKNSKRKSSSLLGFYHFFCHRYIGDLVADKDKNRDLILSLPEQEDILDVQKEQIQKYCESDVSILRAVLKGQFFMWREMSKKSFTALLMQFLSWAKYRIQMCAVSYHGLPLNRTLYEDLSQNHDKYVLEEQKKLPEFYRQDHEQYYVQGARKGQLKKAGRYVDCKQLFETFTHDRGLYYDWPKTASGQCSRDERVLLNYQLIPELAQYLASKKRIKQIQFFKPDPKTGLPKMGKYVTDEQGTFWQHPDFGTFGTTTGRNAHRTESFIMGMERSLRAQLLKCPPEYELLVADYSAQEVWIAGALSGDKNQLKSATIDPYMDFGKLIGLMPAEATKHSHGAIRDVCKSVVLAGFYGMGVRSLSRKIQMSEDKTRDIYQQNKEYYATFFEWQDDFISRHKETHYYELADGWPLFDNCDHEGDYKVCPAMNFPIQGMGAVILRKVVDLFFQNKLQLIYTLHDEFAVLCYKGDKDKTKQLMEKLMQDACSAYFPQYTPPRVGFK